jgi:hypothetical protein
MCAITCRIITQTVTGIFELRCDVAHFNATRDKEFELAMKGQEQY